MIHILTDEETETHKLRNFFHATHLVNGRAWNWNSGILVPNARRILLRVYERKAFPPIKYAPDLEETAFATSQVQGMETIWTHKE